MYPKSQHEEIAEELLLLVSTITRFAEVYGVDLGERLRSAGYGELFEKYKQENFPYR